MLVLDVTGKQLLLPPSHFDGPLFGCLIRAFFVTFQLECCYYVNKSSAPYTWENRLGTSCEGCTEWCCFQVPWDCSAEELKKGYHKAARECHPDRQAKSGSDFGMRTRAFQQLQAAYDQLKDPKQRDEYDYGLDMGDNVDRMYFPDPVFRPFKI